MKEEAEKGKVNGGAGAEGDGSKGSEQEKGLAAKGKIKSNEIKNMSYV